MATVPQATTTTVGAVVTDAWLNALVNTANFGVQQPSCYAYNSSNGSTTIPNAGANATLITLDATLLDKDINGLHSHSTSTNPSRVTANYAGTYLIGGFIRFVTNATGYRQVDIRVNAGGSPTGGALLDTYPKSAEAAAIATRVMVQPTLRACVAGDYFEMFGYQTSGGALGMSGTISAALWIARIGL